MVNSDIQSSDEILTSNYKSIIEFLNPLRDSNTIILGIGNVLKGDDALGPLVCERLKKERIKAEVIDAATVPENYIQTIIKKAPENLIIIDAIDFGAEPGTIKIFDTEQLNSIVISTHTLSPRMFVEMIRKSINLNVLFIGIQPAQTQLGSQLSPQIENAIDDLTCILKQVFSS